jgi:hypothetical protein
LKRRLGSPVLRSPPSIVPESTYWQDEGQPSSLLEETCREQFGRLYTPSLLNAYLASAPAAGVRSLLMKKKPYAPYMRPCGQSLNLDFLTLL